MLRYESSFTASDNAERVLRSGRIIDSEDTPADMISRVATTISEQERVFTDNEKRAAQFMEEFGHVLDVGDIVMSTPVMTNAGRHLEKPLTACTVPTSGLDTASFTQLRREIISLHEQGMGTGFNLDETEDPVVTLRFLNGVAVESAQSGREERPVGNMAVLSVRHPKIEDFIDAKVDAPATGEEWKFNISVDLDDEFMAQLEVDGWISLNDGRRERARTLFARICEAATVCADPGVIFLDRMNKRNPLPGMGAYKTTAPCAEVGLIEGETCQFGYINLGNFITWGPGGPAIDFVHLERTTVLMTRALDNSLEISQGNFTDVTTRHVALQKRKIGIGLCGIADALSTAGLPYDSPQARELMQDALSFINFVSKEQSIRLAEERGSFGAMDLVIGNRHLETPGHLETLYGDKDTNGIPAENWRAISRHIANTRHLRNISTIALPPTGRSALAIDASTGIEPHFETLSANPRVLGALDQFTRQHYGVSIYDRKQPPEVRKLLAGARTIQPLGHVGMAAALQEFTDEALSKTINLPSGATPDQVREVYLQGYTAGMSGVTVYVDGSHKIQPKKV